MHVCCWEFECVVSALSEYWALFAYCSCFGDVADVFVLFGEEFGLFAFAVGLFCPVVFVGFCVYIGFGCVCSVVFFVDVC